MFGYSQFRDLHLLFFSLMLCDLVLSVKFDDQKCIIKSPFFPDACPSLKLLNVLWANLKQKVNFFFVENISYKEMALFDLQ